MDKRILFLLSLACIAASSANANLIVNGDFEAGNTGFDTDYVLDANVSAVGTYYVDNTVPNGWAPSFGDHTSGAGLMGIFNASTEQSAHVWSQQIDLVAGATYDFSFWVAALTESIRPGTAPWIQAVVSGIKPIGTFRLNALDDIWQGFTYTFSATETRTHTLLLREARRIASGDDFALDDLSLVRTDVVSVPEPSSVHLLAVFLGLLVIRGAVARRAEG